MCDISFPKEEMYKLCERRSENYPDFDFIYIDHHISAISDLDKYIKGSGTYTDYPDGLRDTKYAACELTWKYFFSNEPMPEIVKLLGLYDSFRHKGTPEEQKVLEFQYGARQCISNYEEAYYYLVNKFDIENKPLLTQIYEKGKSIYKYLCTEAKQTYKNGFKIQFDNPNWDTIEHYPGMPLKLKFICINKERFNPINFGIEYHKDGYDGAACFHYADGMWNFSLYNDNGEVDCSTIAKQYGGGGHMGSAGMRLTTKQFLNIIGG